MNRGAAKPSGGPLVSLFQDEMAIHGLENRSSFCRLPLGDVMTAIVNTRICRRVTRKFATQARKLAGQVK
jgi:hypothetical protein